MTDELVREWSTVNSQGRTVRNDSADDEVKEWNAARNDSDDGAGHETSAAGRDSNCAAHCSVNTECAARGARVNKIAAQITADNTSS